MARKPKPCCICHERPAAVPDRDRYMGGRFVKQVCRECHAERLRGDLARVLAAHDSAKGASRGE